MPRGDGTGPMGMGSMTGRGAGFCAGFAAPGHMNPGVGYGMNFGRGRGMNFGRGRGFGRMFNFTGMPGWARSGYPAYDGAYAPAADEKEFLDNQADVLENQLQQVRKRLETLNGEAEG